ncbi:strucutural protein [Synechococcus phage S-RSM4]|uniref:Strucutural protein n=1 Tax=Synechococcus phage S-RSM4 TaxID=555387 RepID=C7BVB6_9CAUD|nr:virion structural protein [Synechococcus phage S-RSM4]CAR63345.1 strucutural protein [Synechococcus phage S-RSM4]
MPAIQVARTDTFEQQRQKINEIGTSLFNISSGGSDLSTGNLKLGDGLKTAPSLSFNNEATLGIYRPTTQTIGYVSSGKNILDINIDSLTLYKDEIIRKRSLPTSGGLTIVSGSGYEYGTYIDVPLNGGSGSNGEASIFVDYFSGTPGSGLGYQAGTFTFVPLIGGTGSGASVDFSVTGLNTVLNNGGSGYADGFYANVPLVNVSGSGNGSGATAIAEVVGTSITNISIATNGNNQYESGDILTISDSDLGSAGGAGLEIEVTQDAGVLNFSLINKAPGYTSGDVLSLPTEVSINGVDIPGNHIAPGCTLTAASTTVTLPVATNEVIPGMILAVDQGGSVGTFPGGSTVTVVSITNSTTVEVDTPADTSGAADIVFSSPLPTRITIPGGTSNLYPGFILSGSNYSGIDGSKITAIIDANTIEVDVAGSSSFYQANLTFTPEWGNGGSTLFTYTIDNVGGVETVSITNGGTGYVDGDILTVNASDLTNPIEYLISVQMVQKITFTTTVSSSVFNIGDSWEIDGGAEGGASFEVGFVKSTGGNVDYVFLIGASFSPGDAIREVGTTTTYTIDTAEIKNKYYIDTGSGPVLHPDLTFYVGETYRLNFDSSITGHDVKFSEIPDGAWNIVGPFTTTVSTSSDLVTVSSTSGISVGMDVEEAGNDPGGLAEGTTVAEVVDSTTIRLSENPSSSGAIQLNFSGSEFITGVTVSTAYLDIKITDSTPSTLYYYCLNHADMAGEDGEEAVITVDANNPRVFGSGFSATVDSVVVNDIITFDVETGAIQSESITAPQATFETASASISLNAPNILSATVTASTLRSSSTLELTAGTTITLDGDINLGSAASVGRISGDLLTSGEIKTTGSFNSNDALAITSEVIESINNYDVVLRPDSGRLVDVDATTALVIPVGTTNDRPVGLAQDGAIRFNTETNQYEGYSSQSSSWSSLGGVRDLDGNTYILAEETVGANDNTLWFINDNVKTQKFTPNWHEYVNVKKIRSLNVTAPAYGEWTANSPVNLGDYLKYRNNIYEVTVAGVTASSGSEPTHTSGAAANNTAELTWFASAVAPITYEEVSEVRISPLGFTPLVVSGDLRLFKNALSTDINDLVLRPNSGRRVDIDSTTTLTLPSGGTGDRGNPIQGGVRFNTTSSQFEGYDGTNWGSLGGVKDVDQNTYIIPETSPGANENILYFYNDNNNTARLTTTALEFHSVDTIISAISDELEVSASLITFDTAATTLDNTSITTTFLHSAKQYFDLGLSSGLFVEPVLRLDNQGDVYFNTTFGTGAFNGVKVFDGELKEFELADTKILTEKITLVKGTTNIGSSIIYDTAVSESSKTVVTAHNPTTGDKEMIEFGIIDNGIDVFVSEYGNVRTGLELIIPSFELTANNEVRINIELGADIGATQSINITFVSNITKK